MENNYGDKDNRSPGIVEEDEEVLKKIISGHPLFGLLIETHLNCVKAFNLLCFPLNSLESGFSISTLVHDSMDDNVSEIAGGVKRANLEKLVVGVTTEPGRYHMHAADSNKSKNHDIIHNNPSDLNPFMEAYCKALSSLKEGIEEAQQESASFIASSETSLATINYLPSIFLPTIKY